MMDEEKQGDSGVRGLYAVAHALAVPVEFQQLQRGSAPVRIDKVPRAPGLQSPQRSFRPGNQRNFLQAFVADGPVSLVKQFIFPVGPGGHLPKIGGHRPLLYGPQDRFR